MSTPFCDLLSNYSAVRLLFFPTINEAILFSRFELLATAYIIGGKPYTLHPRYVNFLELLVPYIIGGPDTYNGLSESSFPHLNS